MKRTGRRLRERLDLAPLHPGWGRLALSAALGALGVLGFAPFYFFVIPIAALAGGAWLWRRARSAGQALALGFAFGLGYFLAGTSWVYVSMHDFGGMPAPVAAFATGFFCTYLALFPAAAGWVVRRAPGSGWSALGLALPAAWSLAEWTRGWMFTGFPWLALGYSQAPAGPLSGFAPLLGVYGVSFLAAASAGLLVLTIGAARAGGASLASRFAAAVRQPAGLVLVALWIAGWGLQRVDWTAPAGEPVGVSLVQGNIEQDMKWRPEWVQRTLETYLTLTLHARGRLILLPETALPIFNVDVPGSYLEALARHARKDGGDLLLGIPEYVRDEPPRYYNSVISLGTQPAQTYRKVHLVPFGDYVPRWGFLNWIMRTLDIPMSDFSRGGADQRPLRAAGQRVAVNICYEDVFGEEIVRQLPEASLLANFTNDAWWGDSWASDQHLQMAQMRSQETRRMMLRATNTGVTAVIDHRGRLVERLPQFVAGVLEARAQGRAGSTPYIVAANWPFLGLAVLALAAPWLAARRAAA